MLISWHNKNPFMTYQALVEIILELHEGTLIGQVCKTSKLATIFCSVKNLYIYIIPKARLDNGYLLASYMVYEPGN